MKIDTTKYLGLFATSAAEHLEGMERLLKSLRAGVIDDEGMSELYRHAHSLKGSAGLMGFDPIASIADQVGQIVERTRERKKVLTADSMDLLSAAGQHLASLVRAATERQPLPDVTAIGKQLASHLAKLPEHLG